MGKEIYNFLGGDDFLECNCHSHDNELVDLGGGKFQVVCECGVSGPIGSEKSAVHEWNVITTAAATSFSAAQIIGLWAIETSREQGKDESEFVESLELSLKFGGEQKAELLKSMGLEVKHG